MKGDIAYNGQLDDDLADFVAYLRQQTPDATLTCGIFLRRCLCTAHRWRPQRRLVRSLRSCFAGIAIQRTDDSPERGRLGSAVHSAHADISADIRNIRKPTRVLVGAEDDLLIADAFAPLFGAERSDIPIKIIPGLGHTEISVTPEALFAFAEALAE